MRLIIPIAVIIFGLLPAPVDCGQHPIWGKDHGYVIKRMVYHGLYKNFSMLTKAKGKWRFYHEQSGKWRRL
jgi:hypothetical protein